MKYLGKQVKLKMASKFKPPKIDTFENEYRKGDYIITIETAEFTCLCPVTNQPDFANLKIEYIPNKTIIESKSMKLYLMSFRNVGMFHEFVVNQILSDFQKALNPRFLRVTGAFHSRGGITITPKAQKGDVDLYNKMI